MDEPFWRGRLRLMKYAIDNPDMIYGYFSGSPPYQSWINSDKILPKEKIPFVYPEKKLIGSK